jgi:hypothetical protein
MSSADVADVFTSTRETLHEAGIEDEFFLDLLASRLVVERVGESSNQDWWESRVLSETGRSRLEEVTPKTRLKSQINLALKTGRKAESDRLPDDSISLFSLGPQLESRLEAAIEEMESPEDAILAALESLSTQSLQDGWTDDIIDQTASNITADEIAGVLSDSESGDTIQLGESGYTQDEIEPDKWRLLASFLKGYGQCTDRLQVVYYPLELEIKSESA